MEFAIRRSSFAALALSLAAACASAQDTVFNGMSPEELKEHDAVTWGRGMTLKGEDAAEFKALMARMAALDKAIEKAGDEKVFSTARSVATLEALMAAIQTPLVKNKKRIDTPPSGMANFSKTGDDAAAKGARALDTLTIMLDRLDKNSRWKLMELVDYAYTMQLPQRYAKWQTIVERLDTWKHSGTLAEFDAAFGKFMRNVESAPPSMSSGTTWLRIAGLDRFANADCRKEAFFDRDLRTIDSYLYTLRSVAVQAHKDYLNEFTTKWNAAFQALKSDEAYFKQHGQNLAPNARKAVDSLTESFAYLLLHGKDYVAQAKELILQVDGGDQEIYKLRNCLIGPNKAFYCSGSVKGDGCPGYSRRVRVALEDCKSAYLKAYRRIKGQDAKWQ